MILRSGTRVSFLASFLMVFVACPLASALQVVQAAQEPLFWNFYGSQCELPQTTAVRLSCGGMGVFYFNRGDYPVPGTLTRTRHRGALRLEAQGIQTQEPECPEEVTDQGFQEVLPFYNARPGGKVLTQPVLTLPEISFRGGTVRMVGGAGVEDPLPCGQGECFTPLSLVGPDDDWVAQIDMSHEHYSTVGQAISNVLSPGVRLVLFDLESDLRPELEMEGVTDFHVLQQVCQVLEAFESGTAQRRPPLALNMSFGRYDEDPTLSDPDRCATDKIGCWIGKALRHLHQARPGGHQTELVAAAGNHRELLFPAAYQDVIAVGALDQRIFSPESQDSLPNWESPQSTGQYDGLFPGQGICFQSDKGNWLAEAGSSYSAALLSGLLASARLLDATFDAHPDTPWVPSRRCLPGRCAWRLSAGDLLGPMTGPRANGFLDQILIDEGGACSTDRPIVPLDVAALPLIPTELFQLPISFPQMANAFHKPLPEPSMCIPCDGGGGGGGSSSSLRRRGYRLVANSPVSIDFSGGSKQTGGLLLLELYLRVDAGFIPLSLSALSLQSLSAGLVEGLRISGNGVGLFFGVSQRQVSLLAILQEEETSQVFWSTTPVRVKGR